MERLIDNALIFGAMYEVADPYMIARYNTALEGFGLAPTKLERFVIDASGYSPEIAAELEDEDYLNPYGINRRFIILSPEQESLPIVHYRFSSTDDLMMAFYQKNAESLLTLTLKDVVYGEIENSTFRIDTIDDILSIREVVFKLRTGGQLFEKAGELKTLLNRFFAEGDAWQDNELMNDILTHAKLVGDIRYNNIIPGHIKFPLPSFWTTHFGGIYVFHEDNGDVTIIGKPEKPEFLNAVSDTFSYISLDDAQGVYSFLIDTGRILGIEPNWLIKSGLIDLRSDILVRTAIGKAHPRHHLAGLTRPEIRNWIQNNYDKLAGDGIFGFLTRTQKALLNERMPNLQNTRADLKLLAVRANPAHEDRGIVSRLLSGFAPFDFYTKFAVNKQGFYDDYEQLAENQREFVVAKITRDFFPNRKKYWEMLYAKPEE